MFLKNKSVVVTGAGGFIGSHLAEFLVGCCKHVRALAHYNGRNDEGMLELIPKSTYKEMEIILGDIRDPFTMRNLVKGCDIVFHLGALIAIPYSYVAPASYIDTNVLGTLNILEACRSEGIRMVHTSTSEVYGTAKYTPIDEKHPLQGQSPYSASKISADKLVESYYRSFRLPVVTVRPFNTYGPRQSARAVIPTIITQALTGGPIYLGSLTPVRDMTYVKDTCEGFLALAQCDKALGKVVNLGTGRAQSIGDIVEIVGQILGRKLNIKTDKKRIRPKDSEVMKLISDNSLCRQITGWKPRFTLKRGLAEVIKYIEKNLDRYKISKYNI
jgi:NAD dependent epimerase/dehydratase